MCILVPDFLQPENDELRRLINARTQDVRAANTLQILQDGAGLQTPGPAPARTLGEVGTRAPAAARTACGLSSVDAIDAHYDGLIASALRGREAFVAPTAAALGAVPTLETLGTLAAVPPGAQVILTADNVIRASTEQQAKDSLVKHVPTLWTNTRNVLAFFADKLKTAMLPPGKLLLSFINVADPRLVGNAAWLGVNDTGDGLVAYGADSSLLVDLAADPSVTGHELMHGFLDTHSPLLYVLQSGALNESLADVVGIASWHASLGINDFSKQHRHWVVASGLYAANQGVTDDDKIIGMRSFDALPNAPVGSPTYVDYPVHMNEYWNTRQNVGGIHYNSTILNRAFYSLCSMSQRPSHGDPLAAWTAPVLARALPRECDFLTFANAVYALAQDRFKSDPGFVGHVKAAFEAVGLFVGQNSRAAYEQTVATTFRYKVAYKDADGRGRDETGERTFARDTYADTVHEAMACAWAAAGAPASLGIPLSAAAQSAKGARVTYSEVGTRVVQDE
jgi:hypothetical protein